jgi:DeoR/GlpR family transcriptional regulator of sugar metabolism
MMKQMLTSQRKQMILDRLEREGQVVARELSAKWEVSEDTIRRDLRELAGEGLLQRVHGGALPASPAVVNLAGRQLLATEGQVVALDGGTTAVQVARAIPRNLAATIVTHSPTIAVELMEHATLEVVLIGGRLFKHSMVAMGTAALEQIARIRCDLFFMGVTGVHPTAGLTTGDFEEAAMKRALSRSAAETYVLVSAEKMGAASPYVVVGLGEVAGLITEAKVAARSLAPFRKMGLTVTVAAG